MKRDWFTVRLQVIYLQQQHEPAIFFLAGAFLAAAFLAGAFLATFLTAAFLAGAFFAVAFFATFLATVVSPFWFCGSTKAEDFKLLKNPFAWSSTKM
jgi:hypothetical protein